MPHGQGSRTTPTLNLGACLAQSRPRHSPIVLMCVSHRVCLPQREQVNSEGTKAVRPEGWGARGFLKFVTYPSILGGKGWGGYSWMPLVSEDSRVMLKSCRACRTQTSELTVVRSLRRALSSYMRAIIGHSTSRGIH